MPGAESAIEFVAELFGNSVTQGSIYFSSLANERDGSPEIRLQTRDPAQLTAFIEKNDRAGRGLFVCAGTVEGKRNKDNIREIPAAYTDVDFKDHPGVSGEQIRQAINRAKCKPTVIVHTGHGLHLWWAYQAGIPAQEHRNRQEAVLRALAGHFGGDPQVAEISRLMRLPGTHNTKYESWVEVAAEYSPGERYTLEDLEGWLATNTRPLLQRRAGGAGTASAGAPTPPDKPDKPDNPFLRAAEEQGYEPPIDVEAMLAGMVYPGNVHATQVSVSAALLERGGAVEEVVTRLLTETRKVAGTGKFNWAREERDLRKMCLTWLIKHPQPKSTPDEKADFVRQEDNVSDIGAERAKRKPKPAPKQSKIKKHIVLAKAVLEVLNDREELLLFTGGAHYRYIDRLWRLVPDKELFAWLDCQLEVGATALELQTDKRLINEARAWMLRQPEVRDDSVEFDMHGMVPTKSGLVDPRTGFSYPPLPEHYATWRIECDYVKAARCPNWLRMMNDALDDRDDAVRAELVALLQEILGASLIDARGKALSKALVLWGPQDTGKSGLLDVMAGLFGSESNKTPFKFLDTSHGLMPFEKRRPWLLHEAFDQGAWHFSSIVKSIISGDEIAINMKNGPFLSRRVRAPILWGTNHAPQFKEATRAMAERMIVIRCRKKFDQDKPVGVGAIALRQGYDRPSSLVLATEMEGLLAWAIAGLQRCLERGFFAIPAEVKETADAIARDSNLVAGFIGECVEFDRDTMISAPDFAGAFSVWWVENKGDDIRIPSSDSIGKALASLGDMRIAQDPKELRTNARRFYAGIGLSIDGMRYWRDMHSSEAFRFKERKTGLSAVDEKPNKPIPGSWSDKMSIRAMRKAFEDGAWKVTLEKNGRDTDEKVSRKVTPPQGTDQKPKTRF